MDAERIITNHVLEQDEQLDNSIRPETIDEYIGQKEVKENIKVFVEAAKMRNEPLIMFFYMVLQDLVKQRLHILLQENWEVILKRPAAPLLRNQEI